ncbi:hypothetical protein BDW22DRAFT_1342041 [Trametopsis cervina]|nr:hypothetical protein BDW22DRAFT_1342041 [Trametopsis cervina]
MDTSGRSHINTQSLPYLLHEPQDRDSEFQSNTWHDVPTTGYSTRRDTHHMPLLERPLAGLGISFGASQKTNSVSQPVQVKPRHSEGRPLDYLPPRTEIADVEMLDEASTDAYSTCPSEDFVAHSSSSQHMAFLSYSTADDSSMLVDSPSLSYPKMRTGSHGYMFTSSCSDRSTTSSVIELPELPSVGIIADVNYRSLAAQQLPVSLCVNPADLTGPGPTTNVDANVEDGHDSAISKGDLLYPMSPSRSPEVKAEFPEEAVSAIFSVLAASEGFTRISGARTVEAPQAYVSVPMPSLQLPAFASRSMPVHMSSQFVRAPLNPVSFNIPGQQGVCDLPAAPTHQLSPVFNAHHGIDLDIVRSRADAWRELNPGFELDKAFLQTFAGRLSERGELIPDYRCYVKDCSQSNKRRDHILVHVGSHVEHRPFQCDTCGMRFLRKNECKRHMSSHAGYKPYCCTLCPPSLEKKFVRQDLLKRHMKVAHGAISTRAKDRRQRLFKMDASLSPISEYQP